MKIIAQIQKNNKLIGGKIFIAVLNQFPIVAGAKARHAKSHHFVGTGRHIAVVHEVVEVHSQILFGMDLQPLNVAVANDGNLVQRLIFTEVWIVPAIPVGFGVDGFGVTVVDTAVRHKKAILVHHGRGQQVGQGQSLKKQLNGR